MRKIEQFKSLEINGNQLQVGCYATIKDENGKTLHQTFNKRTGYMQVSIKNPVTKKRKPCYVHRVVGEAWCAYEGNLTELQIDHINGKRDCNRYTNLRWVTRKVNNSRIHAKKMKSRNHSNHSHRGYVIKGVLGEITKYFKNGIHAANHIGCSNPLVYDALNSNHFSKTAYDWKLEYVPISEVPVTATIY